MASHTKGPWLIGKDKMIVDADGRPVASMFGRLKDNSEIDGRPETEANRKLIALAPELLDLLLDARVDLAHMGRHDIAGRITEILEDVGVE